LPCLPITTTQGTRDAIGAIRLPSTRPSGCWVTRCLEDCTDLVTGEVAPVVIVTDNGPA
jgi:hypothetical protein